MNRFDFYPGDYLRDTVDMSPEEDGVYLRLMFWYYSNERPIPDERADRISRANQSLTVSVLKRFFVEDDRDGEKVWVHNRIENEITKLVLMRKRAQYNGKKGGRPKGKKTQTEPRDKAKRNPEGNPDHNPEAKLPSPSPSPSPTPSPKERAPRKRAQAIPDLWAPNQNHFDLSRELGVNLSQEAVKFKDHFKANGKTMKDWDAAFRNWLRRSSEYKGNSDPSGHVYKNLEDR